MCAFRRWRTKKEKENIFWERIIFCKQGSRVLEEGNSYSTKFAEEKKNREGRHIMTDGQTL